MKKFEGIETVILDYGNTIIYDPFENILNKILDKISSKLKLKKKKVKRAFIEANKKVNYLNIGHFAQEEPIVWYALKKLGVKDEKVIFLSLNILKTYRKELKKLMKNHPRKEKIRDVLVYLKSKGKRLGIISDGRVLNLHSMLRWLGIKKYFDFIVSSEEIGIEKPDPRIFIQTIKRFKLKPEECVYVGDDPRDDIEAPKKLGMKMILIIPPKKYRKPMPWRRYDIKLKVKPDAIIKDLIELKKFF